MTSDLDDPEVAKAIRKFSLQNALEYDGAGEMKSVLGRMFGAHPNLKKHARDLVGLIQNAVDDANKLANEQGLEHVRILLEEEAPEALEKRVKERREGLRPLDGEPTGVVLRFAPNPNGPMSLGHSRGVVINSEFARMHEGEVILRFDDTDTKRKPPSIKAYDTIAKEFEWITGRAPDRIVTASERMPLYLEHVIEDIEAERAYVCTCTAGDFKELRDGKAPCPCRSLTATEHVERWEKMNNPKGGWQDGDAVVRIRTDLNLPNPALRDWPALRIQTTPHPKVGDTYRVWPLLDYQSAIEDHLQGVTHIVRGKDLMDSTRKQTLLYEMRGWNYPHTLYWGRVKVHEFGSFSTSAMRTDIEAGTYSGWDDPRLPTIAAFRSKGYAPEAIRSFWLEQGLTQKDIAVSMKTIESHNVKAIESSTPRYSFVQDPVSRRLEMNETWPSNCFNIPSHPDNASMGHRQWPAPKDGDLILLQASDLSANLRLKEFADATLTGNSATVENFDRSDRRQIVHWVLENHSKNAVILIVVDDKIEHRTGRIENCDIEIGQVVQLERIGFATLTEILEDGTPVFTYLHD